MLPTEVRYLLYLFYIIHGTILPQYLFNLMRCVLHPISCDAKLFVEIFAQSFRLYVFLYLGFLFRTSLKLYNILITPKVVKKVTTDLDSSMFCGPHCILIAVLRNHEPELSYIYFQHVFQGILVFRLLETLISI